MKKILSQYLFIFFLLVTVLFVFSMKIELAIKKHTAQQYKEVRFLILNKKPVNRELLGRLDDLHLRSIAGVRKGNILSQMTLSTVFVISYLGIAFALIFPSLVLMAIYIVKSYTSRNRRISLISS
ncbi:hypothetical protein BMR05_16335 [Methylococcaceae bacterium HT4]|uniref:hypothetical protein n=1 Tax=Bathymodiolus platifrons methanotrophic gill symbiont TaxID=113268 RepID=UPI000B40F03A|nr:hypothetical protein [Bathymodiolus platifrons methanotrophic gill symbiont]TXL10821.1 hypothetical protein BMR05_16335 [Methylococcaceae bacterium HT4]TXL13569.1 hypothetical protein BMR06_16745 [Methylococcaceae bacterium HT5]TXL18156.1 hypothetical protein BMR03_15850 [Methylococcaceae bacterium HT2]